MTGKPLFSIVLISVAVLQCAAAPPSGQQVRGILNEALHDGNPNTRVQAVTALGLIGPREPYLGQLQSMLSGAASDKDAQVRLAAIASLVDLRGARTRAALRAALNDDVPEVSFAAAKALFALHDPAGKEALLSVVEGGTKTSSGFFSKQKREALRMMHTPKTMFMFAVRQGAAFAPVPGLGAGIASMQDLLSDPNVSGRAAAVLLLGNQTDGETLKALREALSDKDWSVRAAAVHALALRNDPRLRPEFVPLLDDKKEAVRLRAAAGYLRLGIVGRPALQKSAQK
ncbi:MAG: HEAT repeat domain-containing protein [Acidobacteriota bacterium]|nr:HEAT repeat domain-containing protein [Acidobacteriota bacterium]